MRASRGEALAFVRKAAAYRGDKCLLWPHAAASSGYAALNMGGKMVNVHRLVCEEAYGPPPQPRMHAMHSCDVRLCVNPRHLSWGTARQNIFDALERRGPWIKSKLSTDDKGTIRAMRRLGVPLAVVAANFKISLPYASEIANGKK